MLSKNRIPINSIERKSLYLATQFNDLSLSTFSPANFEKNKKIFLSELKRQCLFHDTTLIRDADIVNHFGLTGLATNNSQFFIENLSESGHLFCIREGFESFTAINESAKEKRANHTLYDKMKTPLKQLDKIFQDREIPIAEIALDRETDLFLRNLKKGFNSSAINDKEQNDLSIAITNALERSDGGFIKFGDIYKNLVTEKGYEENGELVQFCRAAHSLIVPISLGINHLIANNDFDEMHLSVLLGKQEELASIPHEKLLPKKILMDDSLQTVSFSDICKIRKKGRELGYFTALNTLCSSTCIDDKPKLFADYMEKLGEYFIAMNKDSHVELHDWQKALVSKKIEADISRYDPLFFALPVLISGILISVLPVPVAAVASVAATAFGNIAKSSYHNHRKKTPLERLVNGSTVFPLSKF